MVSTRPLISKSFRPCTVYLMTVPSTPITNGITVIFMSHRFFSSLSKSSEVSLISLSFSFKTADSTIREVLFFFSFFCGLSLGLVDWLRLDDLFVSKNLEEFYASHQRLLLLLFDLFWEFFTPAIADGFSQDFKWQVSRILLSILADLNNAVVWIVSTSPVISKSY